MLSERAPPGLNLADAADHHVFTVTGTGRPVGGDEIMAVDRIAGVLRPPGCRSE